MFDSDSMGKAMACLLLLCFAAGAAFAGVVWGIVAAWRAWGPTITW